MSAWQMTTEGLNHALDVVCHGGTQISTWYIGFIANATTTPVQSISDVMSSHAGWTEYTGYSQSTRQQWTVGAAAAASNVNSALVTITNTLSGAQLWGLFVVSNNTKSGTTGTLLMTAKFANVRYPSVGQTLSFRLTGNGAS